MFEQPKISKKLKQQLSKVLSIALSVAMLAGTIPADMLGGIASVKAETKTTTVNASGYKHNNAEITDKEGLLTFTSVTAKASSEDATPNDTDADYFALTKDSKIEFTVPEEQTGDLTIDSSNTLSEDLMLKKGESKIESGLTGLAGDNDNKYVLTLSETAQQEDQKEVKISTISLTLNGVTEPGPGPTVGEKVTVKVEVNDEDEPLLQEDDQFIFTPGVSADSATTETVDYDAEGEMSVSLLPNTDYTLTCSNTGVKVTATVANKENVSSNIVNVSSSEDTITITVTDANEGENENTVQLSGNISFTDSTGGTLSSEDETKAFAALGENSISFVPVQDADAQPTASTVTAKVDTAEKTYTADLESETTYKLVVAGEGEKYSEVTIENVDNKEGIQISTAKSDANITLKLVANQEGEGDGDDDDVTLVKTGTHVFDVDTEFEGTTGGSSALFSTNAITSLGTNDTGSSTYTSADGYFKLHYNTKTRIDKSNKAFDGETKALGINMQGNLKDADSVGEDASFTAQTSFEFTVSQAPATLKVYWYGAGGSDTRDIHVLDSEGKTVEGLYASTTGNSTMMVSDFTITKAGTYYLGCKSNGCIICYVKVSEPARFDIDTEFEGTTGGSSALFSTNAITSLGTNDTGSSTYTSADGYFKLHYNTKTRIDKSNKAFDGETKALGINMQGNLKDADSVGEDASFTAQTSFEFTVSQTPAALKVYWYGAGGSDTRDIHVLDSEGKTVEGLYASTTGNSTMMVSDFTITKAGTYYLGCKTNGCIICYIEVNESGSGSGSEETTRGNWENVAAPEITEIEETGSAYKVTVKGVVDRKGEGADAVTVGMYDEEHLTLTNPQPIYSAKSEANTSGDHLTTLTVTPKSSGRYAFRAILSRDDVKDEDGNTTTYDKKTSEYSKIYDFKLPLTTPEITTLMNLDKDDDEKGGITASWTAVTEADYYILYAKSEDGQEIAKSQTEGTSANITGLTIGDTVYVTVIAYRKNTSEESDDASDESASKAIKITGEMPNAYVMDAGDLELVSTSLSAGTKLGTKDYFTVMLDSAPYYGSDGKVTTVSGTAPVKNASTGNFIEINKHGSAGLTFTVFGTADASFTVASTGSSNKSAFGLAVVNPDGTMERLVDGTISGNANDGSQESKIYGTDTANKGTAYLAYGTTTSIIEYKDLQAGTYTFLSPFDEALNRGGRIHRVVVYDSASMPDRGDWSGDEDKIGTPEISEISYVKGASKIYVTASGYIGYYGADSLKIDMIDSKGKIADTIVQAKNSVPKEITDEEGNKVTVYEDEDLKYEFTPKYSDNYSFRASLVRSGEEDIVMNDDIKDWTVENFVLPLATPSVKSMTNVAYSADEDNLRGSLEVDFSEVDEADYYVVAAFTNTTLLATKYFDIEEYEDAEDTQSKLKLASAKVTDKVYTVTLENLPQGSCYVTVQAFRNTNSALNLKTETTTIIRDAETNEIKKTVEDTLELAIADLKDKEENKNLSEDELREKALKSLDKEVSPTDDGFAVAVVRSKAYDPSASKYVNGKDDTKWSHTVYGSNTTRSNYSRPAGLTAFDGEPGGSVPANGYYEEVYGEKDQEVIAGDKGIGDLKSVTVWSENGRGKVVPASIDGMSYYYTAINPSVNNFTLSALIHVKSWQYSNGQDGFGMMVSDVAGADGDDGDIWTNTYQLLASKIQYSWYRAGYTEDNKGYVTSAGGNGTSIMRYEMKLGVGWNSKEGATAADVAKIKAGTATAPANFVTNSGTLETAAGNNDLYTGSYNIIGNGYNTTAIPTSADKNLLTDLRFQIQKYDNAYVLRYLAKDASKDIIVNDEDENKSYITIGDTNYVKIAGEYYEVLDEHAFSDDNNNKLTQIDKNKIYVGFFAARNARIGVNDIDLQLTPVDNDPYVIPVTKVDPSVTISSEETSDKANYDLLLSANFDGTLTIYKKDPGSDKKTAVITGKTITAGTKYTFTSKLKAGTTEFIYYAKPNDSYVPGENQILSNFNMQTNEKEPLKVTYYSFAGDKIYAAPKGAIVGDFDGEGHPAGSKDYPTNVYDAVNYATAGQTILLAGGTYDLTKDAYHTEDGKAANLLIGKYHSGTSKSYITMKADPDADKRPVLDFGQNTQKNDTAFTMAGDYWRFEGFDVMGSQDGQKGILLAGSHNVLNDIRTYLNGNTGVQIARYSNYGRADWPSYNTLVNCSSFLNYDAGYEDADGYAAKLTCGDGNKFIGCISAYNADDGWDLFAKVESGSIGVVTIENCLAFKNGYLFGIEDYYGDGSDLVYRYTDFSKYNKNTSIVNAGNGNGFKMGGDSMSGYHVLRNSIAFGNKSKGIDSNSCPDIQIYNSISFNNEANNVALYTGGAVNTDYNVEGLISFKDSSCSGYAVAENFDLRGTQNANKVFSDINYYWSGSKSANGRNYAGDVFDISRFENMSVSNAIFGADGVRISRKEDGSIDLHGFLTDKENGSNVGSSILTDVLDEGADIYVFAADYCKSGKKLGDIDLGGSGANAAAKALKEAGYKWADGTIMTAAYAGTAVDFKVTNGTSEKTVTVNFIQLNGAELRLVEGDDNGDDVLGAKETWIIEAVPVISPAVEPDVELSGFKAEIKENSKGLLNGLNAATAGTVNENLKVAGARVEVTNKNVNGDAKITATVSLTAGGKTVKQTATMAFAVNDGRLIKFETIDPTPAPDSDKVRWVSGSNNIQIAMETMKGQTFTLKNLHYVDGVDEDGNDIVKNFTKGVTIKVNDTNVIKLNKINGTDATFTVVNKSGDGGTATVTITSKDDKTLVTKYVVTVSGSEFAFTAGTIEVDKAKLAGVQLTALAPFDQSMDNVPNDSTEKDEDGNIIKTTYGINVAKVYKGTKVSGNPVNDYAKYFEAKQVAGDVYELNTTEEAVKGKGLPKGTYTVVYQTTLSTTNDDGTTTNVTMDFTPVTIKVIETKPTVTLKQTKKVNLFYNKGTTGSTGTLIATSKQGAVTLTATETDYYKLSANGNGYDIVNKKQSVSVDDKGRVDYKAAKASTATKITVKASFDGYYSAYDITKPFTIGVEYKQPKLKLKTLDKTIYTGIGMDSADVWIYDPIAELYLTPDTANIDLVTDSKNAATKKAYSKANADFTVNGASKVGGSNGETGVNLKINSSSVKGGTVKLSITYDDWFSKDPVIVSQSIKVNNKVPKLTIKSAKLNINTEKFVGKEQAPAQILLNGTTGFTIDGLELKGANAKADAFLKFIDYDTATDADGNTFLLVNLKAKADDGTAFPSTADSKGIYKMNKGYASSYSFKASYKLGSVNQEANFKLSLVSRETVTVSTKSSINIIDRDNSAVILKLKTANFTPSQVSGVALKGDAASLFTIAEFDRRTGDMTVQAKDTADLKPGSYNVYAEYTFDLGVSGTATMTTVKPVRISTKQSALKISGLKDPLEVKLSSMDTAAQRTLTVTPLGAYITDMTQISGLENFTLTYTGDGVQVEIKNRAGLKEGTTYKITAYITVEGGGSNVKKQIITIPVRVIR